jgi:hypothetical protein
MTVINLLQIFGLIYATGSTFCISRPPLTILRQTVQLKVYITASRMHFVSALPRLLGLRRSLGSFSDSVTSQGKTLVFPRRRQFLAHLLSYPISFCRQNSFLVEQISPKFSKILDAPVFSLPSKHTSGHQLPKKKKLPGGLLWAPFIWVRCIIPPLERPYDGPYTILRCSARTFTI